MLEQKIPLLLCFDHRQNLSSAYLCDNSIFIRESLAELLEPLVYPAYVPQTHLVYDYTCQGSKIFKVRKVQVQQ